MKLIKLVLFTWIYHLLSNEVKDNEILNTSVFLIARFTWRRNVLLETTTKKHKACMHTCALKHTGNWVVVNAVAITRSSFSTEVIILPPGSILSWWLIVETLPTNCLQLKEVSYPKVMTFLWSMQWFKELAPIQDKSEKSSQCYSSHGSEDSWTLSSLSVILIQFKFSL